MTRLSDCERLKVERERLVLGQDLFFDGDEVGDG